MTTCAATNAHASLLRVSLSTYDTPGAVADAPPVILGSVYEIACDKPNPTANTARARGTDPVVIPTYPPPSPAPAIIAACKSVGYALGKLLRMYHWKIPCAAVPKAR